MDDFAAQTGFGGSATAKPAIVEVQFCADVHREPTYQIKLGWAKNGSPSLATGAHVVKATYRF
ncbi:hypothetical protein [Paraburkholderia sp. BL9I2N2]|jgi:hypothetical protein|uniref:hypothetical protein n=1 Tax=Paraburkholderia sp. BL9I2N2 TaxID=1938809 RepID=UPI001052D2CE|nr:hypothetical protein [Paraburkholderia sp. BL9I2N2]